MSSNSSPLQTDALVIGAGPVGLFQVFELGLQEIHAHVVDVLPEAGGQCMALYADKPIYDIPGLPASTGRDLTQRLLQQVSPFKPAFHFQQQVASLQSQTDGRWLISTNQGTVFLAKTVFVAAGVGALCKRHCLCRSFKRLKAHNFFTLWLPQHRSRANTWWFSVEMTTRFNLHSTPWRSLLPA